MFNIFVLQSWKKPLVDFFMIYHNFYSLQLKQKLHYYHQGVAIPETKI